MRSLFLRAILSGIAGALTFAPADAFDAAKVPSPNYNRLGVDRLDIQGSGSTGDVSGMSIKAPGRSVALPLSMLLDRTFDVRSFGASGVDGVDDAPAINAAIQQACTRGGGEVLLMRRHSIGAPIDNNCSGVLVRGIGGAETSHDLGGNAVAGSLIFPISGFTGDCLRHRTRTATEQSITPVNNRVVSGGGFENITVSGCQRNLHVTSVRRGIYRLTLLDAVGTESALFDGIPDYRNSSTSEVGEAGDIQLMTFDINLRQYDDGTSHRPTGNVNGVVFSGPALGGNVSYNNQMRLTGRVHNGTGLVIQNGDNNSFSSFSVSITGTGRPLLIQAVVPGLQVTDSNYFDHYCSNRPGKVELGSERPNGVTPIQSTINFLDLANSCAAPTGPVTIINGPKAWLSFDLAATPSTGSFTSVVTAEARFRKDPLSDTITFTATLSPRYTSASGGLLFNLPAPARSNGIFTGFSASTGQILWCRMEASKAKGICSLPGGGTALTNSGDFFGIGGTYESQ